MTNPQVKVGQKIDIQDLDEEAGKRIFGAQLYMAWKEGKLKPSEATFVVTEVDRLNGIVSVSDIKFLVPDSNEREGKDK